MDVQSCHNAGGKRRNRDCCSLPRLNRFNATATSLPQDSSSKDDALITYITQDSNVSDTNTNVCTPNPSHRDLNDSLLKSLLTESETVQSTLTWSNVLNGGEEQSPDMIQSTFSIHNRVDEQLYAPPSTTTSLSNSPTMFNSFHSVNTPPPRSQYWLSNSGMKIDENGFSQCSYRSFSSSIDELFYRSLHRAKSEAKYSLRIKSQGNGIDDGYKWRKYGQKAIKNSPYPRSYYRCTNPRCSAKKQVERCVEEPETVAITYEGLHLHYSYSQLQITQPPNYSLRHPDNNIYENENVIDNIGYINACFDKGGADVMQSSESPTMVAVDQHHLQQQPKDKWYEPNFKFGGDGDGDGMNVGVVDGGRRDGLLQDIVPFGIINPFYSSSSSSSSP